MSLGSWRGRTTERVRSTAPAVALVGIDVYSSGRSRMCAFYDCARTVMKMALTFR